MVAWYVGLWIERGVHAQVLPASRRSPIEQLLSVLCLVVTRDCIKARSNPDSSASAFDQGYLESMLVPLSIPPFLTAATRISERCLC